LDTLTPIVAEREDAVHDPYSERIARLKEEIPILRQQYLSWGNRPFRYLMSEMLEKKESELSRTEDARRRVFGDCTSCGG